MSGPSGSDSQLPIPSPSLSTTTTQSTIPIKPSRNSSSEGILPRSSVSSQSTKPNGNESGSRDRSLYSPVNEGTNAVAGPSRSSTQSSFSKRPSLTQTSLKRFSSSTSPTKPISYSNSQSSSLRRSFTNRPSELIDLTVRNIDKGKGKGKAIEPIDLTLSDTDDEASAQMGTKGKSPVRGASATMVNMKRKEGMTFSTQAHSDRGKGKEIGGRGTTTTGMPGRDTLGSEQRSSDTSHNPPWLRKRPSTSKAPRIVALETRSNYNPNGLSPQKAIDLCSTSSGASYSTSPTNITTPLKATGNNTLSGTPVVGGSGIEPKGLTNDISATLNNIDGKITPTLPQRTFSRTSSNKSLTMSPNKKKIMMPAQSTKRRPTAAEWEAAVALRKKQMEERSRSQEPNSLMLSRNGTSMQRTISQESIGSVGAGLGGLQLKLGSQGQCQVQTNSPLRNVNLLPKQEESPLKNQKPVTLFTSPHKRPTQSSTIQSKSGTPSRRPEISFNGTPSSSSTANETKKTSKSTPTSSRASIANPGPTPSTIGFDKKISKSQSDNHGTKQIVVHKAEDEVENEDEQSYRPTSTLRQTTFLKSPVKTPTQGRTSSRTRPEPGAYKLPALDTDIHDWPRINSTHSAGGSMRKASGGIDKGKAAQKNLSLRENVANPATSSGKKEKLGESNDTPRLSSKKKESKVPKQPRSSDQTAMQRTTTNSTSSTLTPLSSRSTTPPPESTMKISKKGYKPSPVKSLSASPVKGKPFPRLFGDETPISERTTSKGSDAEMGDTDKLFNEPIEGSEPERETETKDDDMFADFEDFEWAASDEEDLVTPAQPQEQAVDGTAEGQPASGEKEGSSGPMAHDDPSHTSDRNAVLPAQDPSEPQAQANNTDKHPTSTPATPRSSHKRSNPSPSPTSAQKRRALVDKYEQMMEEDRIQSEKEQKEAEEKERQLEFGFKKLLEKADDGEEKEEEGGDLAGFLDDIASNPQLPPDSITKSSSVQPDMQTAIKERRDSRKAKAEADRLARRQAKLEAARAATLAENAKRWKDQNKDFDNIIKGMRHAKDLDEDLKDISTLSSRLDGNGNGQDAYPTPETEYDDEMMDSLDDYDDDEFDNSDLDMGLDIDHELGSANLKGKTEEEAYEQMVEDLRKGGLSVDESLIRDAKAGLKSGKDKNREGLDWEGFWEAEYITPTEGNQPKIIPFDITSEDAILRMISDLTKQPDSAVDLDNLSNIISSGVLNFVENNRQELGRALLTNAVYSADQKWSSIARSSFVDLLQNDDYFQEEDLHSFVEFGVKLLGDLGARTSILGAFHIETNAEDAISEKVLRVMINREAACALVSKILMAMIRPTSKSSSSSVEARLSHSIVSQWISILGLMSIDKSTSSALRRTIRDTVEALLQSSVSPGNKLESSKVIALSIAGTLVKYDIAVKAAMVDSLGDTVQESRMISRWLAVECLLPGTIEKVLKMPNSPSVPPIAYLQSSIDLISNLIKPKDSEPNYDEINHIISLLYTSMSDIDTLLEELKIDYGNNSISGNKSIKELMHDCEIERVREDLRRCRDRISDQSNGSRKAMVKARLHQLYEITRLTLNLSIKKRIRAQRLGKGLKAGTKGQSKLDFGPKAKARKSGTVGPGEPPAAKGEKGEVEDVTEGKAIGGKELQTSIEDGVAEQDESGIVQENGSDMSASGSGQGESEDVEMILG